MASEVGRSILQSGGNAVDAAVATAFALGVVEPYHSGVGGGSFIVIRMADTGETVAIDAREKAPMAAKRDMYQRDHGVVPGLSTAGPLAVGVPGTLAGLELALEKYGTMSLKDVIAPSIRITEAGVEIDPFFHHVLEEKLGLLTRFPETASIYLNDLERPLPVGYRLLQKDLAETYGKIGEGGIGVFYRGEIAQSIAAYMKEAGGLITLDDLAAYSPVLRSPIRGTYRGFEILSMPPPSSGGVHLVEILNLLEGFDVSASPRGDAVTYRRLADAMSLAFEDRAKYLGDADYVDVPVEKLISKEYARRLRDRMGDRQTKDENDDHTRRPAGGRGGTSHLCVIDRDENVVSLTQTINLWFGSGITVPGTGIILNDEMDDFSAMPGVPNDFGLVGSEANSIEPGKRPLSSMSPTIILKDGKPYLVLGSRGGPKIITSVLQVAVNVIDHGMPLDKAVEAPRIHHQWLPDVLYVEEGVHEAVRRKLEEYGYKTEVLESGIGCVSGIMVLPGGVIYGMADPRGIGAARGY
jgi:gamma-glutamyltranspeptidase/glutathione hydrolase